MYTNIPGMKSNADLQVWNHTIDQSFDTKDFVFAVSVDTNIFCGRFHGMMRQRSYETYSKLMFPMLAGAILGSVLWLIEYGVADCRQQEGNRRMKKLHLNRILTDGIQRLRQEQ